MTALRRLRHQKGWTLERASRRMECSISMLSQVERGERTPSLALFSRMFRVYGVAPDVLHRAINLSANGRAR